MCNEGQIQSGSWNQDPCDYNDSTVVINNDSDNKHGHSKWGIVENNLIMEKGHQIIGCEITMWSWCDS